MEPLVIDFGTGTCQAGYTIEPELDFINVNEKREDGIFVGNECITRPRSAFDRDFLTSHGAFDTALEYIFTKLEIEEAPVIAISETFCNPYSCRALSNEVLFEGYTIPKVSYYVDSLAAFQEFRYKSNKSVLIDLGNYSTRVISLEKQSTGYRPVFDATKTIPFGKSDAIEMLLKCLQLKYPSFPLVVPKSDAEELFTHCKVALDYDLLLKQLVHPTELKKQTIVKQYPYVPQEPLTQEEIDSQKGRQEANRKRLKDMNLAKRKEKLESFRHQAIELNVFLEKLNNLKKSERLQLLNENNYKSVDDVEEFIKTVDIQIGKLEASVFKSESAMDADQVETVKDELPEDYLEELRNRRKLLLEQLETRKLDTTRRSASSNNRMRNMARIIDESNKETPVGDNFGMLDSDWNVYHQIKSNNGQGLDIEIELGEIEDILVRHDPTSLTGTATITSLLQHNGPHPVLFDLHSRTSENVEFYNKNQELAHQLHLNIERFRLPETIFKPYLSGLDERGLSDILESIYPSNPFDTLYLTGSLSNLPQLGDRLLIDLTSALPTHTKIRIEKDVVNQAYSGAHKYYKTATDVYMSKDDYYEHGAEYLKEHCLSNTYTRYEEEE